MGLFQLHRQRRRSAGAGQALPERSLLDLPQPLCGGRQRVRAVLSSLARGEAQALISLSEFDYELPDDLIAQRPLERRDESRMLVLYRGERRWEDRRFIEFPSFLRLGDCAVL